MSGGHDWLAVKAQVAAERLVLLLSASCDRIEIAGSLRRRKTTVHDIEIVCVPKVAADLFGDPLGECLLSQTLVELQRLQRVRWRTETHPTRPADPKAPRRVYSLVALPEGIPLDIFAVRPPAQWGAILAIRTGSAEFSRKLVTDCQRRALRCVEGRLIDHDGETVPTRTEQDFFRECGVPWVRPEER